MDHRVIALLFLLTMGHTYGFPGGIFFSYEEPVCDTRIPGHPGVRQLTPAPYELVLSDSMYLAGGLMEVTLQQKAGENATFRGFIIQALGFNETQKVGEFVSIPSDARQNCRNYGGATVTHNNNLDKTSLTFFWTAPEMDVGDITFYFTVVQTHTVYWIDLTSATITFDPNTRSEPTLPATTPGAPVTQDPLDPVNLDGCGDFKSCYREPSECDEDDCDFIVTWRRDGGEDSVIDFEVQASTPGDISYMAIGFSRDQLMGDDNVIECVYLDSALAPVDVRNSYNIMGDKGNTPTTDIYVGLETDSFQGFYGDGRITCRFGRQIIPQNVSAEDQGKVFNLNTSYTLIMAKGVSSSGFKSYHFENKLAVPQSVNFSSTEFVDLGGTVVFTSIKVHGILMIFAWLVSASVAVLMPRYNKQSWPDRKCNGKQIWFVIHSALMTCTLLLTVAGFITIFVFVKGYASYENLPDKAHPILGIMAMAFVIINPIMAAFRPSPNAPKRPIFNGFHTAVGISAYCFAVSAIFVAMYMPKANAPSWGKWVMVAFVCWQFSMEMIMLMYGCMGRKKVSKSEKYELGGVRTGSTQPIHQTSSARKGSGVNTFLVSIHFLGVLGMALALAIGIGTA